MLSLPLETFVKTIKLTDQSVKKYKGATIVDALLQAIYNAIDADASDIKLSVLDNQGDLFNKNDKASDCKKIIIEDNGSGIDFEQIDNIFLPLEDSWKKNQETTPLYRRPYHGRLGSGRFKYLAAGDVITWDTIYKKNDKYYQYKISFDTKNPQKLSIENKKEVLSKNTGTKLTITSLTSKFNTFCSRKNIQNELISGLLLDLTLCKDNLKIFIQNEEVILNELIERRQAFQYQIENIDKEEIIVDCDIVVWKKRCLLLTISIRFITIVKNNTPNNVLQVFLREQNFPIIQSLLYQAYLITIALSIEIFLPYFIVLKKLMKMML